MPALVALAEAEVVQQHCGNHARRPVGRRRDHPAEPGVLLVHRQREAAHPGERLLECRATVPDRLDPGLDVRRALGAEHAAAQSRGAADHAQASGEDAAV